MKKISKNEAREQGLTHYFTGKPCKHGHVTVRMVKGGACQTCRDLYAQGYRCKNRDRIRIWHHEHHKRSYTTEQRRMTMRRNIRCQLLSAARARSRKINVPFDLVKADIHIPEMCPVLRIPLNWDTKDNVPTLDRKLPSKGYVKGNVYVVSWRANRLKSDGTLAEFRAIMEYME